MNRNVNEDIYENVNVNSRKRRRKKKRKINLTRVFGILFILFFIGSFIYMSLGNINLPYKEGEIEIPVGAGTKKIAYILAENGLIKNRITFELAVKQSGYDGKLRYGIFKLNSNMSYEDIMNELATGGKSADTVTITIPEGYTIAQIARVCEDNNLFTKEEFYKAIENENFDYEFLKDVPHGKNYLEGYLFPNTYEFYADATPKTVIKTMLDSFNNNFNEGDIEKAKSLGYSYNQVITVASIIEREVRAPQERAMVAGVIYNRLKKGQRLEMCSTIQYILGEQHDKIYEADLAIDSPYNTYMYAGLPIGPIANPGASAIEAALNPVSHDYYYFVLMDASAGKHYFSKTFDEHVRAKNKYIK